VKAGGWHQSIAGVVRRTFEAAFEDNIPFLASALSFELLLTIMPFVALLLATVGYLVEHQITTQRVELRELLARLLPSNLGGDTDKMFATGCGSPPWDSPCSCGSRPACSAGCEPPSTKSSTRMSGAPGRWPS
jgi:hypothetical protein